MFGRGFPLEALTFRLTEISPAAAMAGKVRSECPPVAVDPASPAARADALAPANARADAALRVVSREDAATPDFLRRWNALAFGCLQPNPFYESWYLLPSLRHLDAGGDVQLLALEKQGELIGLLPVLQNRNYYSYPLPHWQNWVHANCFLGQPLVARGEEHTFWHALFAWADGAASAPLFLHLQHMPLRGALHRALITKVGTRPAGTVWQAQRAMLQSDLSPGDYLDASLATKKRKELRRQHRRLAEEGTLAVVREENGDGIARWSDQFLALEQRGWKGRAGSALASEERLAKLFADVLQGAADHCRLERLALLLDGKPIAMLASFITPPGAFSYKTAFDEDYARFSPGVLLQRENLSLLERADIDWTDSCAVEDHAMIDHFWREKRAIASHSIGIGGTARRALFRLLLRREFRNHDPSLLPGDPA